MKTTITIFIYLFCVLGICNAKETSYSWPIKGLNIGDNIILKPQDHIDKELIFDNIIITAPLNSEIISPTDGTIDFFKYVYIDNINSNVVFESTIGDFENDFKQISKNYNMPIDNKFLSIMATIRTNDNKKIHIIGIRPTKNFKTGAQIKKGEVLGKIGYYYKKIDQPAIAMSISENGKSIDPISPFGLKSNFKKYNSPTKQILTPDEAKNDYTIFTNSLMEGHPGLYDFITKNDFDKYILQTLSELNKPITTIDFKKILTTTIAKIKDAHIEFISSPNNNVNYKKTSPIALGWINDTLIVTRTTPEYSQYLNRKIISVDGISADSLKKFIEKYIILYDGKSESYKNYILASTGYFKYFENHPNASDEFDLTLQLDNGEITNIKGVDLKKGQCISMGPTWTKFYFINNYYPKNMNLKLISDSVAYLGLNNFDFSESEMDSLRSFFSQIQNLKYKHLIIDVRNNHGGKSENLYALFSLIASEPFKTYEYLKVNKKNNYNFFQNCVNYSPDTKDLFSEYSIMENMSGYFVTDNNIKTPDKTINYKGKVYVLTNEQSFSAATNFAALIRKYDKGIIIGRETPGGYNQMNALKFANIKLPNSGIIIQIPLVKSVFDTNQYDNKLYGRGVIPDYIVNLTLNELESKTGDSILNYTELLIKNGNYICKKSDTLYNNISGSYKMFFSEINIGYTTIISIAIFLVISIIIRIRKIINRHELK